MKFIKRLFILVLFSFLFSTQIHSASENCPGDNVNIVEGTTTPITETNANSSTNYHQLTIPSDGTLSITFTNQDNKTSTFFVGTSCASINDIYNGTTSSITHTVLNITVQAGDTIQLLVDDTGNNEDYTIETSYTIASNTPNVSIAPTTKNIFEGTNSVTLNVTLSEAANKDDISVTYDHNCTGTTTGTITFLQGNTTANLLIDTSGLTAGTSCVATLSNLVGSGDQLVGSITPDTSTITVTAPPAVSVDLTITKTDSADPVAINDDFSYTIVVANNGSDDATNIVVTDTLPSGLSFRNTTGSDLVWNCSESDGNITCTHSGTIASGASNSITINVTAPSEGGTITNEVNVTSDNEIDFSNNSTVEDTTIGDTSNPADLCYYNVLEDGSSCEIAGYFYYAPDNPHRCETSQDLHNQNTTNTLNNVIVYKLYDPNIDNGTCDSPDQGSCSRISTHSITDYSDYGSAYRYDLGAIAPDTNLTIEDTDTWYSGSDVNDIVLYTTYEKDGLTYSGQMSRCPGDGTNVSIEDFLSQVDIVDTIVSATAPYEGAITTKVSNKPNYTMTAVYLGHTGDTQNANTIFTSHVDMTVLYYLSDNSCTETVRLNTVPGGTEPVVSVFTDGDNSATAESNSFTMAYTNDLLSKKITRFKYKALDFGKLLLDMDIDCPNASTNGSASGTVTGIPACLISNSSNSTPAERYKQVFGDEAFVRCWEAIANGEPCNSNTNVSNVPEPYNTEYGCLECSLGEAPYTCSQDAFAIRPDHFDIDTTDTDFPNLLRAGEDYNLTVYGHDYGVTSSTITSGSKDYNQTGGTGGNLDLNQSRYMATGGADDGTLFGDLVWSAWDFNMTNGISNQNGDLSQIEVAGVQYDDVGKINLRIEDREWASVDINNPNDPTPHDCSPDGAYICGDKNVTYIPHHFEFTELNITNQAGPASDFTYIAANRGMPSTTSPTRSPMAARVQTHIRALNKNNLITKNFRTGSLYYENPISVTQDVTVPVSGNPNGYLYPDANESNITNQLVGFGRPGFDDNGTRNIAWDESAHPLEFNFHREINEEANPFDVNGSHYNSIELVSRYVDTEDGDIADINGSRISLLNGSTTCATDPGCQQLNAENNATFYYARTRSSKFFYDDVTEPSVLTPILIDVYCDLGFTECANYGINTVDGQINEINWWLSWNHNAANGDGNVTVSIGDIKEGAGSPDVAPATTNIISQAIDSTIRVTGNATELPLLVEIDLVREGGLLSPPFTHEWLIYNPDDAILAPSPFYKVRFIGLSGWAGHGDTGHVVDSNVSEKKHRRLEW